MPINQILVVDTETTGFDPEKDRIVELASVRISRSRGGGWLISDLWDALVNPEGQPISFGAMGAHHITEEMVDYAPKLGAAVPKQSLLRAGDKIVRAAHNAKFDAAFLEPHFGKSKWICTYKCARRLWPGMESYSNQALRYAQGIAMDAHNLPQAAAHRALFDTVVTAELLILLLTLATPEELIQYSDEPILLEEVSFGEHRGKPWSDVPESYLRWIVGKGNLRTVNGKKEGFHEDIVFTCRHWLARVGI